MFGVSRQTLERLRKEYPSGTRVELIRLDDPYRKIPSGPSERWSLWMMQDSSTRYGTDTALLR